jgi:Ca-activated chloride channel family protein
VNSHDPQFKGHQDIILLSDGDDPANDGEWQWGARAAREAAIPVHTVGIGDPVSASTIPISASASLKHRGQVVETKLHEEPLQAIAQETGGVYVPARTKALPLGDLFRERIEPLPGHQQEDEKLATSPQHAGWFFAGALFCFVFYMALGDRLGHRSRSESMFQPAAAN